MDPKDPIPMNPLFEEAWRVAGGAALEHFREVSSLPVLPTLGDEELHERIQGILAPGKAPELPRLTREVAALLRDGAVQVTSPRYFGLFNPSTLEPSIVADALVALYNPQLAARSHAPAAAEMERASLGFFARYLGMEGGNFHATFTSGGAEANLSAVLAALAQRYPRHGHRGLRGLRRRPAIYVSGESHHSFTKIARMTGLGTQALKEIPTTRDLTLDPEGLRKRVLSDRRAGWDPLLVVGTAGTTGAGVVDPLDEIGRVAGSEDLWFHVDAAWGGAALLSPRLREAFTGIEVADSVTWDAHKWLSVPMGAGMFFARHPEAVRKAFSVSTSYMPESQEGRGDEAYLTTAQWSRRAIGVKVFMCLAHLGADGYRCLIEHQADMGDELRSLLRDAGWDLLNRTPLPVVCFSHANIRTGGLSTQRLLAELYRRGEVWISDVLLGGKAPALRACITSYRTGPDDLRALVNEVETARKAGGFPRVPSRSPVEP